MQQQSIVTLDLEGVLVPEIWIAVAEKTGIDALKRTTRDEPDYDKLMRYRLDVLNAEGITLPVISEVIGGLEPLPGALDFLDDLRSQTQVVILSDTYEEFAAPLMKHLGMPTIFCHRLVIENDVITDYRLRQPQQKRESVRAFRSLNYFVVAAGDSFNDSAMLQAANAGIWFRCPRAVQEEFPEFKVTQTYDELKTAIGEILEWS